MQDFQFSFNPIYKKFVRELKDDESKKSIVCLSFYLDADVFMDHAYAHVKKENLKRGDEFPKITVMQYLNQMKLKLEKQEENNNAAMMGEDYIREVDEYSEETHSDEYRPRRQSKSRQTPEKQFTSKSDKTYEESKLGEKGGFENAKTIQKRINQLIFQKSSPG